MNTFDVVAVGNATVDTFLNIHETNKHFRLDPQTKELCIKSGDKVLIDKSYLLVGGNAANVSVGIARTGFKTAIIAEIGSDEFAEKIKNTLKNERVSELHLKQAQGASAFSIIINYQGERTIFQEDTQREHDFNFDEVKTGWIYLTSLAKKWENAYKKTLDFIIANKVKLAFNPGVAQLDAETDSIKEILERTDILFINKEEGIKMLNLDLSFSSADPQEYKRNMENILISMQKIGPKVIVLTDGKKGSYMIDQNEKIRSCPPTDSLCVERTGAGDAYASGFMFAILRGFSYEDAMRSGTENAASVIGMVGAQPGLLRSEEIEKKLKHD
ncbi:carbohydrate kinase family protein [Patescibacteria group bacterium]|nr:carbohydrate kinase family protein [Patescibacteria group bacterium]